MEVVSSARLCLMLCLFVTVLWPLALMGSCHAFPADKGPAGLTYTAELLHRDAPGSPFRRETASHGELWAERLARDAARVRYLHGAAAAARTGGRRNCTAAGGIARKYNAPVQSGYQLAGTGEYFTRMAVGSSSKEYFMIIDTGSHISWLQCRPCKPCFKQLDPYVFDPAASTTLHNVSCMSPLCTAVGGCAVHMTDSTGNQCVYQIRYGDGSTTSGHLVTDTFSLNGTAAPDVSFGCGSVDAKDFGGAAGVLALGAGPLAFPTQLSNSVLGHTRSMQFQGAATFSYCLPSMFASAMSTLSFEFPHHRPSSHPPPSARHSSRRLGATTSITMPMLRNPAFPVFYYAPLIGISVAGKPLIFPADVFAIDPISGRGGVVVDSGTSITRLPRTVYQALAAAFRAAVTASPTAARALSPAPPTSHFDTCYRTAHSDMRSLSTNATGVPSIVLHFSTGDITLPTGNVLAAVEIDHPVHNGIVCLAFAPPAASAPFSVIGNIQQQGFRIAYDSVNAVLTFEGPGYC